MGHQPTLYVPVTIRLRLTAVTGVLSLLAASVVAVGLTSGPAAAVTTDAAVTVNATATIKATVTGRITDAATGEPIPGVSVQLGARSGLTGADGRYTFTKVKKGSYRIQVWDSDGRYLNGWYGDTVHLGKAKTVRITRSATYRRDITMRRAAVVTGEVVDADGRPVTGGFVRAESRSHFLGDISLDSTLRTTVSRPTNDAYLDERGRFRIGGLPTASVVLRYLDSESIDPDRVGTAVVRLTAGRETEVTITARPAPRGELRGKVTSGNAVRVRFSTAKTPVYGDPLITPDDGGEVGPTTMPAGRYYVWVPERNVPARVVTVTDGQTTDFGTIVDEGQRSTVKGRIVHANGTSCNRCRFEFLDAHGFGGLEHRTDKYGNYRVAGLAAGKYTIKVQATRRRNGAGPLLATRRSFTVPVGASVVKKNVRLVEGYTVSGRVLYKGKPVGTAYVTPQPQGPGRLTDASGRFTTKYLKSGRYQVYVLEWAVGGYRARTFTLTIKGKSRSGVVFRLERGTLVD